MPATMRIRPSAIVALAAASATLFACAPDARAGTTRTVCVTGPPSCEYASIQAAIDASLDEDIVSVAPGRYEERVVVDRRVTIQGPGYGFAARTDPITALNAYTIAGDGSGPSLVIAGRGTVTGAVIVGAIGDGAVGVEFGTPAVTPPAGYRSGTLTNSIVHGNTRGIRFAPGSDALAQNVRVTANAAAGVGSGVAVTLDGAASAQLLDVTIDGSPATGILGGAGTTLRMTASGLAIRDAVVGIDSTGVEELSLWGGTIDVPEGGTAISSDSAKSTITNFRLDGASRPSTTGIAFVGSGHERETVQDSTFTGLATSVRIDSAAPTLWTNLAGNLFRDSALAPVDIVVPRSIVIGGNFVACPAETCPTTRGTGSGASVTNDLSPAMWFTDHYGRDERVTEATAGRSAFVWVGFVDAAGTPVEISYASASPLNSANATLAGVSGVTGRDWPMGRSDWFSVDTPGQRITLTGTVFGRPFTSPTLRVYGESPFATIRPSITGHRTIGSVATCTPGTWPEAPTSASYTWVRDPYNASETIGTGPTRTITRSDFTDGGIACVVQLTFENYRAVTDRVIETVRRTPLVPKLIALGPTWRPMRCGASIRRPCRTTRRIGVRFALDTNSRAKTKATIALQRRVGSRWVPWVRGTIPHPSRAGWFTPSRLVQRGTYRLQLKVPAHDSYTGGSTAWVYWVVR